MNWMDATVCVASIVATAATLRHVWRGGTTLNDHAVAAVVAGCLAVYPTMWLGGRLAGSANTVLWGCCLLGVASIWVLFAVLDTRREQDRLRWAVMLSQVAYAYSLWLGLFVLLWWVVATILWGVGAYHPTVTSFLWPWPLFLLAGGLATWGLSWTWWSRDTVRRVSLPTWHGARAFRVVQLSDLHASPTTTGRDLRRTLGIARSLAPDLIVITGDLVMPFSERNHAFLLDALAEVGLPMAVCPGNHDLPVADVLARELGALGIHWLADERTVVSIDRGDHVLKVEVVGVDFVWKKLADHVDRVIDAMPRIDPVDGRLLLLHDPRGFPGVPAHRFDLVLCGHTHGGQVGTDMFGWPGSVLGAFGLYDQGYFEREGARMWVHRGNWHLGLPPRMGIGSEVLVVDFMPGGGSGTIGEAPRLAADA